MQNLRGIDRETGHAKRRKEDVYIVTDSSGRTVLETLDHDDALRKNRHTRGLVFKNGVLLR